MKSSGNSSATASPGPRFSDTSSTPRPEPTPPPAGARKTFALTGRSVRLDPRTHAVRGDLADVRLADQVFAPHYAEAIGCRVCAPTRLCATVDGAELARLAEGETFELLELTGEHAWGSAPAHGLVGYCDRRALELA